MLLLRLLATLDRGCGDLDRPGTTKADSVLLVLACNKSGVQSEDNVDHQACAHRKLHPKFKLAWVTPQQFS